MPGTGIILSRWTLRLAIDNIYQHCCRLWYAGGPQGQVVTGDAFNARYDMVIRDLKRKKKCVDDVAGWADTLLQLFRDTTEFLTVTEITESFRTGRSLSGV